MGAKYTKLGWCLTGHHRGVSTKHGSPCPGEVNDGKRHMICTCDCHQEDSGLAASLPGYDTTGTRPGREARVPPRRQAPTR